MSITHNQNWEVICAASHIFSLRHRYDGKCLTDVNREKRKDSDDLYGLRDTGILGQLSVVRERRFYFSWKVFHLLLLDDDVTFPWQRQASAALADGLIKLAAIAQERHLTMPLLLNYNPYIPE